MKDIYNSRKRFFGEFYTPLAFAKKAYEYMEEVLGKDFFERGDYRLWDMSCGKGNLESVIDKKHHKYLYMSTLYEEDVLYCKNIFKYSCVFQYDYINDDVNSIFSDKYQNLKMPCSLKKDLENKNIKWLIFINPPFATSQSAGANSKSKKNVSISSVREYMHKDNLGDASRELYAQFLYRIYKEFKDRTILAIFSKTNYINAGNCEKMRETFFQYEYKKGFMFSSEVFEDTSKVSPFSVGFLIWDLSKKKNIREQKIMLDILDENANKTGEKKASCVLKKYFLNNWIERKKCSFVMPALSSAIKIKDYGEDIRDRVCEGFIGSLMSCGNDVIKQGFTAILSSPQACAGALSVTKDNFEKACMIHAVRRSVDVSWINSTEQFKIPDKEPSEEFIADCVIYTLFAASNQTASLRNILYKNKIYQIENHFFPFKLSEIKKLGIKNENIAKTAENEKDRFVSAWLTDKKLSKEAGIIFDIGKNIYKCFYENTDKLDLEKYKIEHFDAGWWQIRKSMEEKNICSDLLNEIKTKHKRLKEKINKKIYEYNIL